MVQTAKTWALYIVIASLVNLLSYALGSTFLADFFKDELIPVLLTLLAINIANVTLISQNIQGMPGYRPELFASTYQQLRLSIIEQVVLVSISIFLLILFRSDIVLNAWVYAGALLSTLITILFVWAMDILRDTGISLFKTIEARK